MGSLKKKREKKNVPPREGRGWGPFCKGGLIRQSPLIDSKKKGKRGGSQPGGRKRREEKGGAFGGKKLPSNGCRKKGPEVSSLAGHGGIVGGKKGKA